MRINCIYGRGATRRFAGVLVACYWPFFNPSASILASLITFVGTGVLHMAWLALYLVGWIRGLVRWSSCLGKHVSVRAAWCRASALEPGWPDLAVLMLPKCFIDKE